MKTLSYKGFIGSIEASFVDNCLFGKIEFIKDTITFEGETLIELKEAFEDAVDEYLELCKEIGKEPEKPFKGSFNVRLGSELHKEAAVIAKTKGKTLNEFVCDSIKEAIQNESSPNIHIHHHNHVQYNEQDIKRYSYPEKHKGKKDWIVPHQLQ